MHKSDPAKRSDPLPVPIDENDSNIHNLLLAGTSLLPTEATYELARRIGDNIDFAIASQNAYAPHENTILIFPFLHYTCVNRIRILLR